MLLDLSNTKWKCNENVNIISKNDCIEIEYDSSKSITQYDYIRYESEIKFNNSNFSERLSMYEVDFIGDKEGDLDIKLFINSYSNGQKILLGVTELGENKILYTEGYTNTCIVSMRISGKGKAIIKKINLDTVDEEVIVEKTVNDKVSADTYLVLTNIYPNYNDLYRNAFVHSRVKLYKEYGINVDVYSIKNRGNFLSKYKFDSVDVYNGDYRSLETLLKNKNYKKILIHFVNQDMINSINLVNKDIPIIIWIHGFEAERWQRRYFNYTEDEIQKNMRSWNIRDEEKMNFMKSIYQNENYKFIFVSRWFKEEVCEKDADCKIVNSYIIPNVINENTFKFEKKDIEKRKKILSIRPFASNKYANDLSVKAILELSKKEFFYDLQFNIYGKGPLFNQILGPIKHFKNVNIYETFLSQDQISILHKQHGIFLCPTRLDSQGVSMCESMSSGLVPITNGVTSIPEYVDEYCGILAREESYIDIAYGIEYLYNNPTKFELMSRNSSKKINSTCGIDIVISKEIEIIKS